MICLKKKKTLATLNAKKRKKEKKRDREKKKPKQKGAASPGAAAGTASMMAAAPIPQNGTHMGVPIDLDPPDSRKRPLEAPPEPAAPRGPTRAKTASTF